MELGASDDQEVQSVDVKRMEQRITEKGKVAFKILWIGPI